MTDRDVARLFDPRVLLGEPTTLWLLGGAVALLAIAPLAFLIAPKSLQPELWQRWRTWLVIAAVTLGPIALGAAATILSVAVLGLLCYREFARATGLFRNRLTSATVALAIGLTFFAAIDNYYAFFVALFPLSVGAIALAGVLPDRPDGFIQRTALATLAYGLFGSGLAHLAFFANNYDYRALLIWLLVATELNDIFAFTAGKVIGGRKFVPRTSPNKTLGGAVGAVVLTSATAMPLAMWVFAGTVAGQWYHALVLAVMISVLGQCGDLLLSSVKRDLGLKDLGTLLPGHGGLLDRCDSLVLVAPAVFHYIGYLHGIGGDETQRLFSAGLF
ncbi:MAG: phosphatidate cytidylyltransferase [Planctomycetota bacterium]